MSDEIWKDAVGFGGKYQVSNLGNVRSFSKKMKGKTIKLVTATHGYIHVGFSYNEKYKTLKVHRLVWEAFNGEIPKGMQINHKDGVKANNQLDNLEVVTRQENIRHAVRTGLHNNRGERYSRVKLSNEKVLEIRRRYAAGDILQKELAIEYGVSSKHISRIVRRTEWTHI